MTLTNTLSTADKMSNVNGIHADGELDGIKLKKAVNSPIPIVNGQKDGTAEDNELHEDASKALDLLKSSYGHKDGISIEEVCVEAGQHLDLTVANWRNLAHGRGEDRWPHVQ